MIALTMDEITLRKPVTPYDFGNYIQFGLAYGHIALKNAYYRACNDIWGERFRLDLHGMYYRGELDMPTVLDQLGDETDFFTAVINAYPRDSERFRLVEGELILIGEAMLA